MAAERTELEWVYHPADLFEAPYQYAADDFDVLIGAGRAVATLKVPEEPVSADVEEQIRATIKGILLVRQLQIHKNFRLEGPRTYQYSAGRRNISIRLGSAMMLCTAGTIDLTMTDAAGNVIRDSKAERIAEHTSMLDAVAPKLVRSAILRSMLESYSRSVTDPTNELVHLYEIRDALSRFYGSEQAARDALGISKVEWQRLGVLANVEPLEQGRHRGQHAGGRRAASESELNEARQIARHWILAFAQAV